MKYFTLVGALIFMIASWDGQDPIDLQRKTVFWILVCTTYVLFQLDRLKERKS